MSHALRKPAKKDTSASIGHIKALVSGGGDTHQLLDVLSKDVGVLSIFSDWATMIFYATCIELNS